MKKLFLLFPALILTMMMNAAVININADVTNSLHSALANANAGDTIVLATGTYTENNGEGYITFDKNITVMAANNATPVIMMYVPAVISSGARAEIKGLKFDATHLKQAAWYTDFFHADDASDNNRLLFDECEFYNDTINSAAIYCASDKKLDSLCINNCKFHDITKSCVYLANAGLVNLTITNSTFANIAQGATNSYYASNIFVQSATAANILIDHCTFYNVQTMNTDYGAIKVSPSTAPVVSNCVFMMPSSYSGGRAVYNTDGVVTNCLTYNYTKDSAPAHGIHSGPTITNCIEGNPLFTNATNGDFTFANNWTTMNISPACGNATDGTDLGDPRWHTNANLTTLSLPYNLDGNKANLLGNIRLTAVDSIQYYDKEITGIASWKIHVDNGAAIKATIDMAEGSNSGTTFKIIAFDAKGNKVDSLVDEWRKTNEDIVMPGSMYLPKGDLVIRLYNEATYSKALVDHIQLSYCGGAVQSIPGTIGVAEAWYSAKGSREDNMISFTNYTDNWAKWHIAVPDIGEQGYAVTLNISNLTQYGHRFYVSVYEEGDEEHAQTVGESAWNDTYDAENPLALSLGNIAIKGGKNYIVKVTNTAGGSKPKIISVDFASLGGAVQNMPGTTNINEAWFIGGTRTSGKITFTPGHVNEGWAKWNVACTSAANYNVTLNVNSGNGKKFTVALQDANGNDVVTPLYKNGGDEGTPVALEMGSMNVPVGNYILKVSNAEAWSDAELISVKFERQGGGMIDIPGELTFDEVILSQRAWIDNDSILFTARGDEGYNKNESAKWNVHSAGGWYTFSLDAFNSNMAKDAQEHYTNGQKYKISVIATNEIDTMITKTGEWENPGATSLTTDPVELPEGNYIVEVKNVLWGSCGRVMGVSAAYEGGALVNIPNATIPFNESLLYNGATRDLSGDPQQIHFGSVDAYAQWNIHATETGIYTFTIDVVGEDYGKYKLTVIDNEDHTIYDQYVGHTNSGSVDHTNIMMNAGNYTIKVANVNDGSEGYITNIAASAVEVFVLDENTEADGSIANADGETYKFLLKRSFTAGRYYTICLPVGSWNDELKLAFGTDYELWEMTSAVQSGDEISLNFEQINGQSFHAGRPYLIKPSVNVQDPILYNAKEITNAVDKNVQSFTAANFEGTFYKSVIPAGENNLYLQDNELFYNENDNTTIKGTRAWIRLKPQGGANNVKAARIVLGGKVATEISLINGELINGTVKAIENGQLVIIRDGIRYNVMGAKIQ